MVGGHILSCLLSLSPHPMQSAEGAGSIFSLTDCFLSIHLSIHPLPSLWLLCLSWECLTVPYTTTAPIEIFLNQRWVF